MVIMSGIVIKEQQVNNNLADGLLFKRGYTNSKLSFKWIKHSNSQIKATKKGKYRLLITDRHSSYLTNRFISYCDAAWWLLLKNHLIWAIVVPAPRTLMYLVSSGTPFS